MIRSHRGASSAHSADRRNPTSTESTFGGGTKTVRETRWVPVRSQASCVSTDGAPYAPVPGCAKSRSPSSRWIITAQRSTVGMPCRDSMMSGVATLYGRFETNAVGGGVERGRVEVDRVLEPHDDVVAAGERGAQRRLEAPVELDRVHERRRVGEHRRHHAEPGPDLDHDVVGLELGQAERDADEVVVDQEVLAEPRVRHDPELGEPRQRDLAGRRHGSRNARAAFASTCSASASDVTPRRSATNASVSIT